MRRRMVLHRVHFLHFAIVVQTKTTKNMRFLEHGQRQIVVIRTSYGFSQVIESIKKKPCCRSCYPEPTFSYNTCDEYGQVYNIPPLRRCKGHQAGKHDTRSRTARNIKTRAVEDHYTYVDNPVLAKGDQHSESHVNFEHTSAHSVHQFQVNWMPPYSDNHDNHPVNLEKMTTSVHAGTSDTTAGCVTIRHTHKSPWPMQRNGKTFCKMCRSMRSR
jgi:hypothetical protein